MSTKLRVYEVARDLGLENKALVALLQSVGVSEARNHMSAIAPEAVERVKRHLEKQNKTQAVVEERIRPTVVKRRAVGRPGEASAPSHSRPIQEADERSSPVAARAAAPARVAAPAPEPAPVRRAPTPEPRAVAVPTPAPQPPPPASAPHQAPPSAPRHAAPAPEPVHEVPAAVAAPVTPTPAPISEPEPPPAVFEPVPEPEPVRATPPPVQPPPSTLPTTRPSTPPKTGIDVWEGRPGVPMPQVQRGTAGTPRRVQYDPKAAQGLRRPAGPPGMHPGMPHRPGQRPGMRGGRLGHHAMSRPGPKAPPMVTTLERSAHKKVVRIEGTIGLQALAGRISAKATEVLMKLMRLGMTGVNINTTLDADTAKIVANEFGWEVEDVAVSEADQIVAAQGEAEAVGERLGRPPVVTVMGHVDHGKTSLLDRIRKSDVAAGEAGGITQHIGAYSVETPQGPITFLDTPGHEAFTAMRARGARTTDLVVLVVAADDGVMPQTREAINHAKAASVPIVVAVNKIDKPDANSERVKRQLSELGLVSEEWGGETLYCEVSAVTGAGIENLLEQIVLQAELLELNANPTRPATGVVIEAELDRGRGPVATILINDGTLHQGDVILAGGAAGKVRAMHDSYGRPLESAGPSTPVVVIGLADVPAAGDPVHIVKDMKKALEIAESRKVKEKKNLAPSTGARAMSLEELHRALQENDQLELKLIIKADVQGSVEAVAEALTRLSTEKVKVSVVHAAVGAITEGDVNLALAAGAIIIGFNVRPAGKASALAQKDGVQIRNYSIIYNVVDEVKAAMEGLLAPTDVEKNIGKAEVRQVFKITKSGNVAGCMVIEGSIKRSASIRLVRDSTVVWQGKIEALKRFKDDAREVKEGFDCGISLENYQDVKVGDILEAFEIEQVKQTL